MSNTLSTTPDNTSHPAGLAPLSFVDTAIRTFEGINQLAELMAKMGSMPTHLVNKPADCFRIVVQAAKWRMDPFSVAECTSLVHGRMCYEGKLVAAVLHSMGALDGRLEYEIAGKGQDTSITVTGTPRGGKPQSLHGTVKDWRTVTRNKEGQVIPNAWDKDPASMLVYRGTRQWTRLYAPEALLGVYTPDEFDDVTLREVDASVHPATPAPARTGGNPVSDPAGVQDQPTKPTKPTKSAPPPGHPSIALSNQLWTTLEQREGKGKGTPVVVRVCKLHGANVPKELHADKLEAFGKDIQELINAPDITRIEELIAGWEHVAQGAAS